MQDSLEDYLNLSKTTKQNELPKISKEMIVTAELKKECDARAMKIVEFSIEGKLRPEVFIRCLPFINQSHYQDIVEERAITKLCGYSLCGKRIPDMPKKQYFISTKSNKVYDITERKNFCSNFCYNASLHIKKQIDNSPLWLRKLDDIPEYKLLNASEGGLPGEFIDQGIVKPVQEPMFTSINTFTQASLGDLFESEIKRQEEKNAHKKIFKSLGSLKSTMQTIKENDIEEDVQANSSHLKKTNYNTCKKGKVIKKENVLKKSSIVSLPSIEENEERIQKENDMTKTDDKNEIKLKVKENIDVISAEIFKENLSEKIKTNNEVIREPSVRDEVKTETIIKKELKENIEQVYSGKSKINSKKNVNSRIVDIQKILKHILYDWLTLESCIFLHGEQKVKQILTEKKLSDYFDELNMKQLQREQQMKYMEICRRLQLQEMVDEKFDNSMMGNIKLKPLPDYKRLKEDTKDMKLKVISFYHGDLYIKDDSNFPIQINTKPDREGAEEEAPPAVLPPVDVKFQNLLRRKIFLGSINKVLQQLLQSLGFPYLSAVLSDLQALVKTFNLRADNITFKPILWNYIALVLLSILSIKDDTLREFLADKKSQEYILILLESVSNKTDFLNDLLSDINNIETFIEGYITKSGSIICDLFYFKA